MKTGYQFVTSSAVLGGAGVPVVLYGVSIVDDGAAGTVNFKVTNSSGTIIIKEVTTPSGTSSVKTVEYAGANGVTFPSGCYVEIDGDVSSATVFYDTLK